jgi:hypothetical protein
VSGASVAKARLFFLGSSPCPSQHHGIPKLRKGMWNDNGVDDNAFAETAGYNTTCSLSLPDFPFASPEL